MKHNKGGVVILIPDKVDFRTRNITREPQRCNNTESIHQRGLRDLNVTEPSIYSFKIYEAKMDKT